MSHAENPHSALMDDVYRYQRLIYDVTRKYYLLGRDHLIAEIAAAPGARVLEVACGTGRNLEKIGRRYPKARLYGFDISAQMLISAEAKLGARAKLAQGDACAYDPAALFDADGFDHIVLSYALSMIPDWEGAVTESLAHLAPGGALHIVDFGDQAGLPRWFDGVLRNWLRRFHVTPRDDLADVLARAADPAQFTVTHQRLYRSYAQYARITRKA